MNERIDKLLIKAGAYFGGEGVDYSNFDPKKFAELIIQECITALRTDECNYSDLAVEEFTRNRKRIRKHFGVEE